MQGQLPPRQKIAWESWTKWRKANPHAKQAQFFRDVSGVNVATLHDARKKMGDVGESKKKMGEEAREKISKALKASHALRKKQKVAPVMQTLTVPETIREEKAVVVICGMSQLKELLNGLT